MSFEFQKLILFPAKEFVLKPNLSADEVFVNLEKEIDFVSDSAFKYSVFSKVRDQKFEGDLTKEDFTIHRIVNYRNALLPEIYGYIEIEDYKPVIYVEIKANIFATIMFYLFFVIGIFVIIKSLFFDIDIEILFPIFVMMFLLVMGVKWYKNECIQTTEDLKEILQIKD